MSKKLRAADQELFSFKNRNDIKSRSHRTNTQKVTDFIVGVAAVMAGTAVLVYYQTLIGALICLILGCTMLFHSLRTEQQKTTIERSEFLNALLSSAIGGNHKFAMIVTQTDGQIVYLNHGFQALFPKTLASEKRYLSNLLKSYSTSDAKSKSILAAVDKGTDKEVVLDIKGKGKETSKIKFKIEQIARPSGFIMIRGE